MVNREAIVSIVKGITEKKEPPCKKTLQKIVYLIECKGIDLGCDFTIHFYGPYSADLDYAIRELSDDGILKIQYSETEHRINTVDTTVYCDNKNEVFNSVIEEFAKYTPNELELITTALYVYLNSKNDISQIKYGVKKIKGSKFSEERIENAIKRLQETGYIA